MSKRDEYRATIYGRPATVRAKLSLFDHHIAPYARAQPVDHFVDRCIKDWSDSGMAPGTVKILFSILKDFVKFAWNAEIDTKRLHFKHFNHVTQSQSRVKVWTPKQVKSALSDARIKNYELFSVMTVALETGMRRGELFALTWNDVDLIKGEITISKSIDIDTGLVGPTKTKKTRTIQMSNTVANILQKGYTPGKEGDRCFRTFNPNQQLKALCKAGCLPVISFHDLRHTFATTCLEKGMSPKWVSATLGHAKLSTTLDIYWQYFQEKVDMENLYE